MSDPGDADRLREMKSYFAGRLPGRIAEVEAARDAARSAGWTAEPLRTFHRLAHSLAGAGATFGFPEVSDLAGRLEHRLKTFLGGAPPMGADGADDADDEDDEEVEDLLVRLRSMATRA